MNKIHKKEISKLTQKLLSSKTTETEGKKYIYDKCRKKKVIATPEEYVRQTVLSYFRWFLRTPLHCIQTEVSMKQYGYTTKKDRADILILRPDGKTILAVVECKAEYIEINQEVIDQMLRYANTLNVEYAFATNGNILVSYRYDKSKGYIPVNCPQSYKKMCGSYNNTTPQIRTFTERTELARLNNITYIRKNYRDYIGSQTQNEWLPFLANLCDALRDIRTVLPKEEYATFTLLEDQGVRTLEITVPGGNVFNNHYRVFKIRDKAGKTYKIGMAISVYGNDNTMLAVGVDNGVRSHHALQLIFDTNIKLMKDNVGVYYEISHRGKINVGRKGSAKISEVLEFVKSEMPLLIRDDNRIQLGIFRNTEMLVVTSPEFKDFFERVIAYTLILEKFREYKLSK